MTGKQRALRALSFQETDRVPVLGGFAVNTRFLEEASGLPCWPDPRPAAVQAAVKLGADLIIQLVLPKPPGHRTESEDGYDTNFDAPDPEKARFRGPEDVVDYIKHLATPQQVREGFDREGEYRRYLERRRWQQEQVGENLLWIDDFGQCSFMWYVTFGYQPYLEAIALYPEAIAQLWEYSAENGRLHNELIVRSVREEGLPPFAYSGQDICDCRGPMVSLRVLDELYFPLLKHAVEPLVKASIRIIWHSDGNIMPIVDKLLEVGVAGFQGFQEREAGVDFAALTRMRTRWGMKPILVGSVSVVDVLPFGSVEDVEKDVERCIDTAAPGGGFLLAPTSTAGPEIPKENLYAFYRHGIAYGSGKG